MGLFSDSDDVSIKITLDQQRYFPGQTVSGTVQMFVSKHLQYKQVTVTVRGEVNVETTKTETYTKSDGKGGRVTKTRSVPVIEAISLFKNVTPLAQADAFNDRLVMGEHWFKFQQVLPSVLPTSFNFVRSDHAAEVFYEARVEIVVPQSLKCNILHSQPFAVVNSFQGVHRPVQDFKSGDSVQKMCCFGAGMVNWTVSVPRGVWLPGQQVDVQLDVDASVLESDLHGICAELKRTVEIFAGDRPTLKDVAASAKSSAVIKAGSKGTYNLTFTVPTGALTTTQAPLFNCYYSLNVFLKVNWGADLKAKLPMEIQQMEGPIPIQATIASPMPHVQPQVIMAPQSPVMVAQPHAYTPPQQSLTPPQQPVYAPVPQQSPHPFDQQQSPYASSPMMQPAGQYATSQPVEKEAPPAYSSPQTSQGSSYASSPAPQKN